MKGTNTATSNAILTPEARAVVAAGAVHVADVEQAAPVMRALQTAYSGSVRGEMPAALYYLAGIAEGKHRERQRRADAIDLAEADSVALEKAIVLLNDVIDFLDSLCVAIKRGELDRALFKANDVNPALQKAFILADIMHDMDAKTDAIINAAYPD